MSDVDHAEELFELAAVFAHRYGDVDKLDLEIAASKVHLNLLARDYDWIQD